MELGMRETGLLHLYLDIALAPMVAPSEMCASFGRPTRAVRLPPIRAELAGVRLPPVIVRSRPILPLTSALPAKTRDQRDRRVQSLQYIDKRRMTGKPPLSENRVRQSTFKP